MNVNQPHKRALKFFTCFIEDQDVSHSYRIPRSITCHYTSLHISTHCLPLPVIVGTSVCALHFAVHSGVSHVRGEY